MPATCNENPAVMDDGRSARAINAGCINAGAAFFGYFLSLPKESNMNRQN